MRILIGGKSEDTSDNSSSRVYGGPWIRIQDDGRHGKTYRKYLLYIFEEVAAGSESPLDRRKCNVADNQYHWTRGCGRVSVCDAMEIGA